MTDFIFLAILGGFDVNREIEKTRFIESPYNYERNDPLLFFQKI